MQTISIGRDSSNGIILNDNFISRKHAQLVISDNGQVMIKDLGSSNGTFINGSRIRESYLNPGDIVKCATVFFNWQEYVSSSSFEAVIPVSLSPQAAPIQSDSKQIQNNQNISSGSPNLAPKSFNDMGTFSNQNEAQTKIHSINQQQEIAPPIQQNVIVMGKAKSVGTAFILAFFFGPLGLLYASIIGGIVMFFVSLVLFFVLPIVGYIIAWVGCIIWALVAASQANEALQKQAGSLINNNFKR